MDLAAMTGLEQLRALMAGAFPAPSMAKTLGFALTEVSEGFAVFTGLPSASVLNPYGTVHGGWAMTIIDSACGCAAQSTLPVGGRYTTVETKANFARPILADTGEVRCEARVVSAGRTIIVTEAKMSDVAGRVLAFGTSTLLVLSAREAKA